MRIIIEPSDDINSHGYRCVVVDTRSNQETTPEAVKSALDAVVAYEHHVGNVAEAAREWAEEKLTP